MEFTINYISWRKYAVDNDDEKTKKKIQFLDIFYGNRQPMFEIIFFVEINSKATMFSSVVYLIEYMYQQKPMLKICSVPMHIAYLI